MQTIDTRSTGCPILEDPWLSRILGYSAGRIEHTPDSSTIAADWRDAIGDFHRQQGNASKSLFLSAKVDTNDVQRVVMFSNANLYVVDVNVTWERTCHLDALGSNGGLSPTAVDESSNLIVTRLVDNCHSFHPVKCVSRSDVRIDAFIDIAANAFRYSRFHLDPELSNQTADQIKSIWFANSLAGQRGDEVWLAWWQERPVGFLTSIWSEPTHERDTAKAIIDLVGVTPSAQGIGVGRALMRAFIEHYAGRPNCRFQVGTQVANLPAQRLYLSCGFRPARSTYVMHGHYSR